MNPHLALLGALCATLGGCISLEGIWFTPDSSITSYEPWPNSIVPAEHIELVQLPGTAVEDEEEAPVLWGVWVSQCLDPEDDSTCADHAEHPEFDPARRARTVLYFHGNGGHLGRYWDRIQILWRMGYRVFAVDYRGFGLSTGTPTEEGVYADARTALAHVKGRMADENPLIDPDNLPPAASLRLAYYGWSLGSTAAIQLSTEDPPAALVTEAALASAQAFVDDAIGVGLSSTAAMDTRFDNLGKIPFVLAPKLFTHGTEDDFVKFEFSELLFAAARDPRRFVPVPGAKHGNVPCPTRDPSASIDDDPCIASEAHLDAVGDFYDEFLF